MPTPWTPTSALGHAVDAAGFTYDPDQDIIFSRMYPFQRSFGYAFGYDTLALGMASVIDCEPIFFDYDGKHWMIELWKGQYGLETGCEIGVYTRVSGSSGPGYDLLDATLGRRPGDAVATHNLFYDCASDPDRLVLAATLRRDGVTLFSRGPETHWWLTGFKWGVLSDPTQLSMDVSITLEDAAMRDAFLAGIAGRPYPNLTVTGTTVSFTFEQPFAVPQPERPAAILAAVNASNQNVVDEYNALGFPSNDPNVVQADFLGVAGLEILRRADQFGLLASQLAAELGEDLAGIVAALADGFGVAASTIETWFHGVSLAFSTWVGAVERYLGLPLDFSSYVEIDNTRGASDLLLTGSTAVTGSYVVSPPAWIPKGSVGRLVLQDPKPSFSGSEGTVSYRYCDANLAMQSVLFSFECPFVEDNTASSSQAEWACFGKSGDPDDSWSAPVPGRGHPLFVAYVIGGADPDTGNVRQVTRTRKERGDITHLCGDPDDFWGPVPVGNAINQILSDTMVYFTSVGGDDAYVIVVDDPDGPYLRTDPDATPANNLDDLPGC